MSQLLDGSRQWLLEVVCSRWMLISIILVEGEEVTGELEVQVVVKRVVAEVCESDVCEWSIKEVREARVEWLSNKAGGW